VAGSRRSAVDCGMVHTRLVVAVAAVVAIAGLAATAWAAGAQERDVPKDSERISIPGCARGNAFVVTAPASYELVSDVESGQRFRLAGPKTLVNEIKSRGGSMVEITGLVRKSQRRGAGGIAIAGGRIRVGGAVPQSPISDPARDPAYNVVVIDVESWRPLPDSCPSR
jgi:hypothetical protein